MTHALAAAVIGTAPSTGPGEAVMFWVLAPVAVLAAIGMLATKKAVHSALLLALIMICLAVFYVAQDAVFLGVVQVVVYTGAVMMLFLFVLMLVGVDSSDSLVETIRGQRWAAVVTGLGFGLLLIAGFGNAAMTTFTGLGQANTPNNVVAVAELIFTRYVWAFEVTSALLITAALGAMVLAHGERTTPRKTQRELSEERFRSGRLGAPLPPPGVYARHNAVDVPALLPDGSAADLSVSKVLEQRGDIRRPGPRTRTRPAEVEKAIEEGKETEE
ncbi:MAG: NADH-quinone oxidoreductase subunit J [Streptomycetales bacterium]